ncbi:MAG: response regulator transcription factor [Burkholderiales bacterium]|nr:response regulator transcription factor [Opitutaceae bacterium]
MSNEPQPLILIVEDEPELAKLMSSYLEEAGMRTQICHRAQLAARFLKSNFANLLLLDITLPDKTGFELLEQLREDNVNTPVIFVTGNSIEESKVRGLEMGGDDYITKPFSYPELVARIRAVLRRAEGSGDLSLTKNVSVSDDPFEFCHATINPQRLEMIFPDGKITKIGRKEIGIMAHLKAHEGEVIPRKALIHAVWGIHANVRSRSLDQYIVKVRDFCRASTVGVDALRTVHGVGYIFDPEGKHRGSTAPAA